MIDPRTSSATPPAQAPPPATRPAQRLEQVAAALVTLLVTLIRIALGRRVTFCGTPDSCAYLSLAESLGRHQGFTQHFLYQYQSVSLHLPSHGIEYWRPGISLLLLLAKPFGGVGLHASIVITSLAAIALALAAWQIALHATANRRIACLAYLLCLVLPSLWASSLTPDSPIFYGLFAAWFLVLFPVNFRGYVSDVLALLCIAGVNFIRNDAVLLLIPLLTVLWLRRRSGRASGASNAYIAVMVLGFFAAMLPMALLQYAVLGKLSTGATTPLLFLTDLSDLSRYGGPPLTLHSLLAHGFGSLLKLRLITLPAILYHVLFIHLGFAILFLVTLAPKRTVNTVPRPEFAGSLAFALTVLTVYGLVLPAIGGFSAMKSLTALFPLIAALIVIGIYNAAASATTATALASATILLYIAFGITQSRRDTADLNKSGDADRLVAAYLATHGADLTHSLIMTDDAAQFSETTGYAAIPVPANGPAAIAAAAHDLHATCILLDQSALPQLNSGLRPTTITPIPHTTLYLLTLQPTPNP